MPIYEYHCKHCDTEFDLLQSIKSDPVADCPKCHKKAARKISMPAGLVFKGSGFYITDYKNKGAKSGSSYSSPKNDKKTDDKASDSQKSATDTSKTKTT